MNNHRIIKIIMTVLIFLLLNQIAIALGISPAKKVIDFVPNKNETITFNLINNEHKDLKVVIGIRGDLTNYIELSDKLLDLNKNEDYKEINLDISLPEKIERFGLLESTIKVSVIPKLEQGTTFISTVPSIKAKLQLRVPYPYKYIESRLFIDKNGKKVRFVMPIFNYGSENIENVKAFLNIFDAKNNLIKELETNSVAIDTRNQAKLSASWEPDSIGTYYVIANLDYDGKILELKESFDIGVPFINITKISVDNFILGDIAKFDIYLESNWNDAINVYGEAVIFKNNKIYLTSKTDPIDLLPQKESIINLYWDTKNIVEGDYNLNFTIKYSQGKSVHIIRLNVNKDSIITSLTPTISKKIIINYFALAAVILVIINILWFIYYKKLRKR